MDKENKKPEEQKRPKGNIWVALIVSAVLVLLIGSGYNLFTNSQYEQTTFSQFMDAREAGQLLEVEIHTDRVIYSTKEEADRENDMPKDFDDWYATLMQMMEQQELG